MCDWSPSSADDTNLIITVNCDENKCGIKRVSPDRLQCSPAKRIRTESPTNSPRMLDSPSSSERADLFLQSISDEFLGEVSPAPPNSENNELSPAERKKKGRCMYFPNCTNPSCQYFHPTDPCKNFLTCTSGSRCLYIHPPCKFGSRCTRRGCSYAHTHETQNDCKFGFACPNRNNGCAFRHPLEQCKFMEKCRNQEMCMFSHSPRCQFGLECRAVGCSLAHTLKHERSFSPTSPFASDFVINISRDSL